MYIPETVSTQLEAKERSSFDQPYSCSNVALAMNVTPIDHVLKTTRGWGRNRKQLQVVQGIDVCYMTLSESWDTNDTRMSGLGYSFPEHFGFLDLSNATDINPLDVRISQNCTLQSAQLRMRHEKISSRKDMQSRIPNYLTNMQPAPSSSKFQKTCWLLRNSPKKKQTYHRS